MINNQFGQEDYKFFKHIRKIHKYLAQLDKHKYLDPKFGDAFNPLSKYIKDNCDKNSDAMSQLTSNLSVFKQLSINGTSPERSVISGSQNT